MKTIFRYMLAAAVFSVAAACTKSDDVSVGTYEYVLDVAQETEPQDTRTTMDGISILWSAEDQIGLTCTDATDAEITATKAGGAVSMDDSDSYVPSTSASFTLNIQNGQTPVAVGYPYFDGLRWSTKSDVTVCKLRVPASQKAVKGNIPQKALAMVGAVNVEEHTAHLHNAASVIGFEITRSDIKSLEFKGNNQDPISAESWYDILTGEFVASTSSADSTVTLKPSTTEVFEPGLYYFVVAPVTLKKGFTITLTNAAGETAVRAIETPFTLVRNKKYTGFGSDETFEFPEEPDTPVEPEVESIVQTLTFSDGNNDNGMEWPFAQEQGLWDAVTSPVGSFYTSANPEIQYYFHIGKLEEAKNWSVTNGSGLRFGGKTGDYMRILPPAGYRLAYISILSGGTNTKYSVRNAAKEIITGGDQQDLPSEECTVEFNLTDKTARSEYRLVLESSKSTSIKEMTITYELVK